ncbi:MAG: hypothetical protein R2939_22030 [Kofleriaceae bacterium]
MKRALLALPLLAACDLPASASGSDPELARAQLATAPLAVDVATASSGGAVTARLWADGAWTEARVELPIVTGSGMVSATDAGELSLDELALELGTIELAPSALGESAQLTDVRVELVEPALAERTTWLDDDTATAAAMATLRLRWSLVRDGEALPLAPQVLPPMPLSLAVAGDGYGVDLQVGVDGSGPVWAWADVVELEDLALELASVGAY